MNKIETVIFHFYEGLANYSFYSSLNNNERANRMIIKRTCMYLRNMKNTCNKGKLYKSVFKTIFHNRNKYGNNEYRHLLEEAYISAFQNKNNGEHL